MDLTPVTLEGTHVRLEPLALAHFDDLMEVAADPQLWRWTIAPVTTPEALREYMDVAIRWQHGGLALPFATISREAGKAVGSTRFANVDHENRRVEIGWTWLGRAWQRTPLNTEAKYLMLRHAFEVWGCIRVELKTDVLNEQSRAAMRRIGATEEGVFRKHIICASGRIRDSVYYSVVDDDWPRVKRWLEDRLAMGAAPVTSSERA